MEAPRNPNSRAAVAMLQEFARSGVADACISPGSRSTPIVTALRRDSAIRPWVILDERSAGFFALGMARETRRPVLLVCTSGTAAANYLPAVVEASLSKVPLIVLTADRPPEARDVRAAQTIDQVRIFGTYARWSMDLAAPYEGDALERFFRTVACRAVAVAAQAPAGPVHLNFPLREPLVDVAEEAAVIAAAVPDRNRHLDPPWARVYPARTILDDESARSLAGRLRGRARGVIVCGPRAADRDADAAAVVSLAERLNWPILADPLSGLRFGIHDGARVVDCCDVLLRDENFSRTHRPDAIIQFGDPPVSKPLAQFVAAAPRQVHLMVAEAGAWPDPFHIASDVVPIGTAEFCAALNTALEVAAPASLWLSEWTSASARVRAALDEMVAGAAAMFEGKVVSETIRLLPDHSLIHVGNSMPVRDLDTFAGRESRALTVRGNRGANGIDGVVSTAMGAAATRALPTALIIGDLSCLHDLGALQIAARYPIHLLLIVINNDGGGIFSFLPQAGLGAAFEPFFATSHDLDFESAATLGRAHYSRANSWPAFETAVLRALETPRLHLIEIRSDRNRNFEMHRRMIDRALDCLRAGTAARSTP